MYQTNVVQGPTALSVLISQVEDPWYLHSVVEMGGDRYMVILGYRQRKPQVPALVPTGPPDLDAWKRWDEPASSQA